MNFILRNLGWILLIIFFVFMLYLISNQNNAKNISPLMKTGALLEHTQSGEVLRNQTGELLPNVASGPSVLGVNKELIQKVEEELKQREAEDTIEGTTLVVQTGSSIVSEANSESSLVQTGNLNQTQTGKTDTSQIGEDDESHSLLEWGKEFIGMIGNTSSDKENGRGVETSSQDIVAQNQSTQNQDNEVIHTVAVSSLYLNDAWFTKKLGTVYKGDTLKQLTATNKYGCFKTQVVSSQNEKNVGMIGWACEYYMEGKTATLASYQKSMGIISEKSVSTPLAQYKVATHSLKLNDASFSQAEAYLSTGDTLQQLTPVNAYGCFKAQVLSGVQHYATGKIGWVCQEYLKKVQ